MKYCPASTCILKLVATSPSGKKFYLCEKCGYKTDWSPKK